jgi:hypothetical protein
MNTSRLVQKLWICCNGPRLGQTLAGSPARKRAGASRKPRLTLRDDGMSYGNYVEQLTYLLFLKMADERSRPSHNQPSPIPAAYAWPALLAKDGEARFRPLSPHAGRAGQAAGHAGADLWQGEGHQIRRRPVLHAARADTDGAGCRRLT